MSRRSALITAGFVIAALVLLGILFGTRSKPIPEITVPPMLESVNVEKPEILIYGKNLGNVEVWAIPTGTNIKEKDYVLLGKAAKEAESNGDQRWVFEIPAEPVLATEVFIKALDDKNTEVGRKSLPYQGATAVFDALWR